MTLYEIAEYFKDAVFPQNIEHSDGNVTFKGLTKREYFAAMAMQGLVSNLSKYVQVHQKSSGHELVYPTMDTAVIIADALIAELNK
jgi:hypothetical protein